MEYEEWNSWERTVRDPTQPNTTQRSSNTNSNDNCNAAQHSAGDAPRPDAVPLVEYGDFSFSPMVKERIEEWLRYKEERRETYTPTGLRSLLAQLRGNIDRWGEPAVMALMAECMAAGYRGIVFDRLAKGHSASRREPEGNPEWMRKYMEQRDRELKKRRKAGEG